MLAIFLRKAPRPGAAALAASAEPARKLRDHHAPGGDFDLDGYDEVLAEMQSQLPPLLTEDFLIGDRGIPTSAGGLSELGRLVRTIEDGPMPAGARGRPRPALALYLSTARVPTEAGGSTTTRAPGI